MNLEVAKGAMKLISSLGKAGYLELAGISIDDFKLVTGSNPWMSIDRNRVSTTLHALIIGSVDAQGLPRFPMAAEYIAAGICMFVGGVNTYAACHYMGPTQEAESYARQVSSREVALPDPIKPERLHALVVMLYDLPSSNAARALFSKNVGIAVERSSESEPATNGVRR